MVLCKDITKTRRPIIYPRGKIIAHENRYAQFSNLSEY